jgi:protein ImuB
MLFACLYIPDFPVQAALRNSDCNLAEQPAAILDGPESLLKVFAVNDAARRSGIDRGMTRLQAETCIGIVLRKRSPIQEESSQAVLVECAYGFSPRVESAAPGIVIADLTGTESLLGAPRQIGRALQRCAEQCGFIAKVGVASNPDTALHAASGMEGIAVIAPGKESVSLSRLPIEVLNPDASILDVLDSWGIRDFGALAGLPPISLVERLGQQGLILQRLARGEVQREIVPCEPPLSIQECIELEEAIDLLEPLAFVLNRLLEQATARLRARSLATDVIHVTLELEVHPDRQLKGSPCASVREPYERNLKLPVPTQDSKLLLKLLQLDLAQHPPKAPVKKITLVTDVALLRHTQTGLFEPLAPEPGQLEITLSRLNAVVGEKDAEGRLRVGAPEVLDSHAPDNFEVRPFRSLEPVTIHECLPSPQLALRIFRPPVSARVEVKQGNPAGVVFNGSKGKVLIAAGPWRSNGRWWNRREQWDREEWDVTLGGDTVAGIYRIFRDSLSGLWFVEGMYD